MSRLADWMATFKPDVTTLTLWREDFDLLRRDPETAAMFQVVIPTGGLPRWRKYTLTTVRGRK
jgi:hypothetical protein